MRLGLIGLGRIGAFHADTLSHLDGVDSLVVTDAVPAVTASVAERFGAEAADSPEALISSGVDGIVIAAATDAHTAADQGRRRRRHPGVLREAAVRRSSPRPSPSPGYVNASGVPVQIGYPRRFDPAFRRGPRRRGRPASSAGCTPCGRPPWTRRRAPRGYIAVSGGIFRDCSVHDFDTVRWVTGREVVEVYATGSARGDDFFAEFGDVATAQTLLTFDDGATAVVSNTRYNARGYDVRLELHGTGDSVAAGWTDNTPLRNLEPGVELAGRDALATFFMDRLADAFRAELTAFTEVVAGQRTITVHRRRRAGRDVDRRGRHPFPATAPPGADRRGPDSDHHTQPPPAPHDQRHRAPDRRRTHLLGSLRGPQLGLPAHPGAGARRDARRRPLRHRARPGRVPAGRPRPDGRGARRPPPDRGRRLHPGGDAPARPRPAPRDRPHPRAATTPPHAEVLVLSAVSGLDGYDSRPDPRRRRLGPAAAQPGPDLRPWPPNTACAPCCTRTSGTMVENGDEVQRVLEGSAISLCLDTGHLLIGGTDPADLTRQAPDRIAHTHLKDVDSTDRRQGPRRPAHLHRGRRRGHVPAAGHRRRRRRSHREHPAGQRLRRLVHPRAGHHPHRGAPRRRTRDRRPDQRRLRPQPARTGRDRPSVTEAPWNHCASECSGRPASASWPSSARRGHRDPPGRRRRAGPGPGRGVRRTARHRAGPRRPTPTSSPTPRSRRSTTRSPTACTRRGTRRRSSPGSTCSPRSRPPATPPRPPRCADLARGRSLVLFEGFHYLYHPLMQRLHVAARRRRAGRRCSASRARMVMPAPAADDPRWSLELAGGALMDLGCYACTPSASSATSPAASPAWSARPGAERAGAPRRRRVGRRAARVPLRRHRSRPVQHGQRPLGHVAAGDRQRRGGGHPRLPLPAHTTTGSSSPPATASGPSTAATPRPTPTSSRPSSTPSATALPTAPTPTTRSRPCRSSTSCYRAIGLRAPTGVRRTAHHHPDEGVTTP